MDPNNLPGLNLTVPPGSLQNITLEGDGGEADDPEIRGFTAYDLGFLVFSFMCLVGCYSIAFIAVLQGSRDGEHSEKVKAARDDLILSHLIVRKWHKEGADDDESSSSPSDASSLHEMELVRQSASQEVDCDESSHHTANMRESLHKLADTTDEEMGECCAAKVLSDVESINDDDDFDGCAICLAPYENHQEVCESNNLSCNHIFHKHCMIAWLKKHNQCPVCRQVYILETV